MNSKSPSVMMIAVVLLVPITVFSQLPAETQKGLWKAEWITMPTAPQRDSAVLHFRKAVEISRVPEHFVVRVSADTQFVFNVNQNEVGRGPARSDLAHWKYETYDVAKFLHTGRNDFAATVWSFGVTPLGQIGDRTAFLLQGEGEAEAIANTNSTWEVEQEKGVQILPNPPGLERFYYVAEPAQRTDGAVYDWSWNEAASSRLKWEKATSIGNGSERGAVLQNNNWQLVADSLPPMVRELAPAGHVVRAAGIPIPKEFPEKSVEIPAHTNVVLLLDRSQLISAYPELTVTGGAGSSIRLTYAEALFDDEWQKGNRNEIAGKHPVGIFDEFLPDGATARRFVPLAWRTWRYLQIEVNTTDQPLRIDTLRVWFTAYPFEQRAEFESDDPSLSGIWETGWRTARLDAHDTYMDTPYYERMQYVGDTRIQALISYIVAGDDRLARQAIQAFNDSRVPDGLTRSRYPSSLTQIIPPFSLLWVGMVHDFWRYRGDEEFVRLQMAGTRSVLDWFLQQQRPDGLLGNISWWPFVDWGKDFDFGVPPQDANGGSSIITLQYVEALRYAAELETRFGDAARAKRYRDAETSAVNAIRKLCWNDQHGLLADTPAQKHYSQHANILGVWLDVIPPERQKNVVRTILSVSDAGFQIGGTAPEMTQATYYFRFYLARAILHAGMGDEYLKLLEPWREMLKLGLTTWAEQPEPTRSDCHAWSAHPNFDLLTIVAGIRPKAPGFAEVTVEPHLGELHRLRSGIPTPKGTIEVSYTRSPAGVKAEITLPAGVSGELVWKGKTRALHGGVQKMVLP